MDLLTEIEKFRAEGYSEENAEARLCQDIVLQGIVGSSISRNITIKGGVVMRNLSKSVRRATQDVDIDFIRYSLDDDSIERFISRINTVEGVHIKRMGHDAFLMTYDDIAEILLTRMPKTQRLL